jgi:fructose-specific phosphotransferase system IIA component
MRLTDHLPLSLVKVPLDSRDKAGAIAELVDLLAENGITRDRDSLLAAVMERERARTTGIGRGFAIPHAKCDCVSQLVIALGRAPQPIDFAAIDGQPVQLIALLASPTRATSAHIQALAKLSRLVTNATVWQEILGATTAADLHRIISENDVDT